MELASLRAQQLMVFMYFNKKEKTVSDRPVPWAAGVTGNISGPGACSLVSPRIFFRRTQSLECRHARAHVWVHFTKMSSSHHLTIMFRSYQFLSGPVAASWLTYVT